MVSPELIDEIVQAIVQNFSPIKIILFGSYTSGHPNVDSDLDMLVVMNSNLPRHKRSVPFYMLFRPLPCAIDFIVYTPEEYIKWKGTTNHIITTAVHTGKVLYECR